MVKTISGYPNAHDNRNAKSNVKSRLGLKSSSSKAGKTSGIVKKVERAGPGQKNEIKLFTKHFDARNKIKSNPKNIKTEQHTKKADVHKESQNSKKKQQEKSKKNNKHSTTVHKNGDRLTVFTGKSIEIVAKNNTAPKIRESFVKGKMLSITATTKTTTSKNRKARNTPKNTGIFQQHQQQQQQQQQQHEQQQQHHQQNPLKSIKTLRQEEEYVTANAKPILSARMIISNLHHNVTQDDIRELFGAVGPLREARLKNLGTAEVVFESAEDAFAAYNKYNTRNLDGQPMILKITTVNDPPQQAISSSKVPRSSSEMYENPFSPPTPFPRKRPSMQQQPPTTGGKPVVFTVRL